MARYICDFTKTGANCISIWQWSYGQEVELIGDNITAGMTVQWSYPGITGVDSRTITADGDDLYAAIPNDALEQSENFVGYIYYFTETEGETRYAINVDVRERATSDETGSTDDTPTWQQLLLDAQEAIDEMVALLDTFVTDTWQTCTMGTYTGGTQVGSVKCRKDITGQYIDIYAFLPEWNEPVGDGNYLFLLPVGYRPSHRIDIPIMGKGVSGTYEPGWLQVNTNGEVKIGSEIWSTEPLVVFVPEYNYFRIPLSLTAL